MARQAAGLPAAYIPHNMKYIGPAYTKGLLIPGMPGAQRPASWGKKQIADFAKQDPERYAKWFTAEVPAPKRRKANKE